MKPLQGVSRFLEVTQWCNSVTQGCNSVTRWCTNTTGILYTREFICKTIATTYLIDGKCKGHRGEQTESPAPPRGNGVINIPSGCLGAGQANHQVQQADGHRGKAGKGTGRQRLVEERSDHEGKVDNRHAVEKEHEEEDEHVTVSKEFGECSDCHNDKSDQYYDHCVDQGPRNPVTNDNKY